MSVFTKTTEKIKRRSKNKPIKSRPNYNKRLQICPNLDENNAMKSECYEDEELQCQLCMKETGQDLREPCRSYMSMHIFLDHAPDCPNCKIEFKNWRQVSEHQPFCVGRARVEMRMAQLNSAVLSLAKKVSPPSDWSFGETDSRNSGNESWMS